jgi:hypothetical protein
MFGPSFVGDVLVESNFNSDDDVTIRDHGSGALKTKYDESRLATTFIAH